MTALPQPAMHQDWKSWGSALLVALLQEFGQEVNEVAVVNRRLHGPAQVPNSATVVYTSPAKTKTVLRELWVSNPTVGAVTFTLAIGADSAPTRLYDGFSLAAGAIEHRKLEIPLEAGEVVRVAAGTASALVIVLSGTTEIQRA